MWIRLTADFDYSLPSSTTAYKAGFVGNVTRECAERALAKGIALRLKTPRKGEEPKEHG